QLAQREVVVPERHPALGQIIADRNRVDLLVAQDIVRSGREALQRHELEFESYRKARIALADVAGDVDEVILVGPTNHDIQDGGKPKIANLSQRKRLPLVGVAGPGDGVRELGRVAVNRELDEVETIFAQLAQKSRLSEHGAVGRHAHPRKAASTRMG